jgi:malectin (di-glucose binding ER protein)
MSSDILRVNCGGAAFTDTEGLHWLADKEWEDGCDWGVVGGQAVVRETTVPVIETPRPELYRSERHRPECYRFRLGAGAYTVRMHFAETFDCAFQAGRRSITVRVCGRNVCTDMDPYREAGGFGRPVIFEATGCRPVDGILTVSVAHDGMIQGIEIEPGGDAVPCNIRRITRTTAPCERTIGAPLRFASDGRAYRTLFIGNSGTFYWAIPESVQAMLATGQSAVRLEPHGLFNGGRGLDYAFEQTDASLRIAQENYDLVVLQEGSKIPLADPDRTARYVERFDEVIRRAGSRTVLYAYPGNSHYTDDDRARVMALYAECAERHNTVLIPACEAFSLARAARPDLVYHNADQTHMAMCGGYVIACTFYAVLTGGPAVGHPAPAILAQQVAIEPETATFLQTCADDAVAKYAELARMP